MPLAGHTTHTHASAHRHTNPSNRNQAVCAEMLVHMVRQAYRNEVIQVKSGHGRLCCLKAAATIQIALQLFVGSGCRRNAHCHNDTLPVPRAFDSGHDRECHLREGLCYHRLGIPGGSSGLRSVGPQLSGTYPTHYTLLRSLPDASIPASSSPSSRNCDEATSLTGVDAFDQEPLSFSSLYEFSDGRVSRCSRPCGLSSLAHALHLPSSRWRLSRWQFLLRSPRAFS